jgi:hypothetical protein
MYIVSIQDCMDDDGTLRASCRVCLARRHESPHDNRRAADEASAVRDREHGARDVLPFVQPVDEAVEAAEADEFDDGFSDGPDLMEVDLPNDCAVTQREAILLRYLNQKLDAIEYTACDDCLEEGFDLCLADGRCSRCRADSSDPVRKWSPENKVHPAEPSIAHRCSGAVRAIAGTRYEQTIVCSFLKLFSILNILTFSRCKHQI